MASKFVTWLEAVPADLKKFFTNPVVDSVITSGLGVASLVDPALAPLFGGIIAAVTKAEALAAAANVQNGSGAQKLSLALADAQAAFTAYETATGVTIESAQQTAIINSIVALLNNIPAATVASPVATVTTIPTQATPTVQVQVASGSLL